MDHTAERYAPQARRILLGLVVAPLMASGAPFALAALASFIGDPAGFVHRRQESVVLDALFIALVGAYPITIVFGLPALLLLLPLARRVGYGPVTPILTGFAVAFAGTVAEQALDHAVRADGYLLAAGVGLDGAFGGLVFWLVVVGFDRRWRAMRRRASGAPDQERLI